jgi:vanillate O-demethylase ferredoxin subunit
MNASFDVRVRRRSAETKNIINLELENLDGSLLPPFTAGAHIDFIAPNGMLRQYSLYGKPSERQHYLIGVLRDPKSRGASEAIHQQVQDGDVVRISAPKNHFELSSAKHSILLAAGIGVTPLLSMAEQLEENGSSFELHYYARSKDQAAFLSRIEESAFSDRVIFHFDDELPDHKGYLDTLLGSPDSQTHLYICGPSGFIELACTTAADKAWPASQIHFEHFSASQLSEEERDANKFDVCIASTGAVYHIPKNKSISTVLLEKGINIPVSCEEGVCGTCITTVLEGEPDHKDFYFSEEEKARSNQIMPCCSRSVSPVLVLDL